MYISLKTYVKPKYVVLLVQWPKLYPKMQYWFSGTLNAHLSFDYRHEVQFGFQFKVKQSLIIWYEFQFSRVFRSYIKYILNFQFRLFFDSLIKFEFQVWFFSYGSTFKNGFIRDQLLKHFCLLEKKKQIRYAAGTKDMLERYFKGEDFPAQNYIVKNGEIAPQYI